MLIEDFTSLKQVLTVWLSREDDPEFQDRLDTAIDLAHAEIIKLLRQRRMQDLLALPVEPGLERAPMPVDFGGFTHAPWILEHATHSIELMPYTDLTKLSAGLPPGLPIGYSVQGGNMWIAPRAGERFHIIMPYHRILIPLSPIAPKNFVIEFAPNLYFYSALAFACAFASADEEADEAMEEFVQLAVDMAGTDAFERFSGSPLIARSLIVPDDRILGSRGAVVREALQLLTGPPPVLPPLDLGQLVLESVMALPVINGSLELDVGGETPALDEIEVTSAIALPRMLPRVTVNVLDEPEDLDVTLNAESFAAQLASWTWRTPGVNDPRTAWSRGVGNTPTTVGGPGGGANPTTKDVESTNPYAYTEASGGAGDGNGFSLEGPIFDASKGVLKLTFDVHMAFYAQAVQPYQVATDGTLQVQGWNGSAWSNIGPAIVGSQQVAVAATNELAAAAAAIMDYEPSSDYGTYTSAGFSNADFRFRFLFTKGTQVDVAHYDAGVDNLQIRGPEATIPPVQVGDLLLTEAFQAQPAAWTWQTPGAVSGQTSGNAAWSRGLGPPPTATTGPAGGSDPVTHLPTAANPYAFTESSDPNTGPYTLESPVFNASLGRLELRFDVFMRFGSGGNTTNGTLQVQGFNGTEFVAIGPSITGSQQSDPSNAWKQSSVFGTYSTEGFSNTNFRFRFRFTEGGTNPSNYDCSLDNLQVFGPPGAAPPDPGGDALNLNSGLRRLHVSKGGALPIDGTTPDLLFTTLQAGLNALQAGDLLSVGDGDYFEDLTLSNKAGTVPLPIMVRAENPLKARVTNVIAAPAAKTQVWRNDGDGVFSMAFGERPYFGVHVRDDGEKDFLFPYLNLTDLRANTITAFNATTGGNTTCNKPPWGCAFSGGRIHIRLRNNVDPNGQEIRLSANYAREQITLTNVDNFIWDGVSVEGGGNTQVFNVGQDCANFTVRNAHFTLCRHGVRAPTNAIFEGCEYRMDGFEEFAREIARRNGTGTNQLFMLCKGYINAQNLTNNGTAVGGGQGNATLEGSLEFAANYSVAQTGVLITLCKFGPCFDGSRIGEYEFSELKDSVFFACRDDGFQNESFQLSNATDNDIHDLRFLDCFLDTSHQEPSIIGPSHVYRCLMIHRDPLLRLSGQSSIKMISTPGAADVFYHQNTWDMDWGVANGNISIWSDFGGATANRILNFYNNIIICPLGLTNGGGPNPQSIEHNVVVAQSSGAAAFLTANDGVFAGTTRASMLLNDDYSLQGGSPAVGAGRSLISGHPDSRTGPGANDDCGAFPLGEVPTENWPRPMSSEFVAPGFASRWTSPGA